MVAVVNELEAAALRWCCDEQWLDFETTDQVTPMTGVVGQDDAADALRFGLECIGEGQNIFVRGIPGTGRMTLVRQLLEEVEPASMAAPDYCYVHDFSRPDHPTLICLAPGSGPRFSRAMDRLVEFVSVQLGPALQTEAVRARRSELEEGFQQRARELSEPFEGELREHGFALVPMQVGRLVQPTILPVIDGKPVPYQELENLRASGELSTERFEQIREELVAFGRRFEEVGRRVQSMQGEHLEQVRALMEREARAALKSEVSAIVDEFAESAVRDFLVAAVDDIVNERLGDLESMPEFARRYRVNIVQSQAEDGRRPVVIENAPSLVNLLGSIEREFLPGGMLRTDHLMIQGGALLRAAGGYLILDAREVLVEPGAWKVLVRTLRTGQLDIVPSEAQMFWSGPQLKPESIPLDVKVILIGDPQTYAMLEAFDPDFVRLFKVLADFESTIPRDANGVRYYSSALARLARDESLAPLTRRAVVALSEHGARIAGRRDRLTSRFGRLADIVREAAFLARKGDADTVDAEHVVDAIRRGRRRADLPARRFRTLVDEGTIRIQTEGTEVGQINGLAVVQAGPLTYGFPTRITATIGPGSAGTVNIEREAELSGAIHTKGFYILGGLLRRLLRTEHPLAFSASIAFEQSYGGIDGDSASGAEMCCLMSALTEVPLRQDLAMTGAIDQIGHVQPIGAATEKVEGFYAVCAGRGLTGSQGVLIPKTNAGDLMLSVEVVDACARGEFHVYAVDTIHEALALLTGRVVVARDGSGAYPDASLLRLAEQRARRYWEMAVATPRGD